MNTTFKKALLAGTAIVAVGSFAAKANAAVVLETIAGATEWATDGNQNQAPADGTGALAGDTVDLGAAGALTVTDDGANNDGTAGANFVLGAVTGTTGDLAIVDAAAGDGALVVTIDSFLTSSTGDFTVNAIDAEVGNISVGVTNDLNTGGVLSVINTETGQGDTVLLTVGDDLTVTGATTLTAGAFAGATSGITVTDDAAFTAAATVTGGAGVGSFATLTIGGDATFAAGVNLVTDDKSILVLNGTSAQDVKGVISGAGDINISNNSDDGVTFIGDSTFTGELTVNNDTKSQAVTFTGDFAGKILLGDNSVADTITANFDGTTLAISGGITGGAAETVHANFLGGSTITLSGAASSGIDLAAISGNTTVTTNQNFGATKTTVASGSTLATTANTITSAIVNSGTLQLGGGSVTGAITGTGLLDVNASGAINGAITQGTADIAGGATLTQSAASGWTVGSTNFSGAGTLALLGGAQTIAGNFTNTTDGQGTITITDVAATTAITGNLGASTLHSLAALTVAGGAANVTTTTGQLYVDAITQNAADTLKFIGTSAQAVSGSITGGIVTVGSGATASDVTFTGAISGATSNVATGATARFDGNVTDTGTHTNTGTSYVAVGKTLSADVLTDTGSYILKANDANLALATADFGSLTDSGANGTLTGSAANRLIIDVTGQMAAGTVRLLTGINAGAATLQDTSRQFSFVTVNNGANTDITVARATLESLALGDSTAGAGTVLDTLVASADTQIAAAIDNLAAAGTSEEVNDLLASVTSTVDGGNVAGAQAFAGEIGSMTETRLASLRDGTEAQTGMAAGEMANGSSWWVQGIGSHANQDERDHVAGYDADTYGIALGGDTENLADNTRVGVAFGYANIGVDSDNLNSTETDIDAYQLALYGDYNIDSRTYVAGQIGYVWGSNDTTRHNVGGIAGLTANGDFNSKQIQARAEVGRDFMSGQTKLTPKVIADYTWYDAEDYTETGAGGLNLQVNPDSVNVFNLGAGVDAGWTVKHSDGSFCEPALHAVARYDLANDNIETTNSFTGGGASFQAVGADPARAALDLGADLTYHSTTNWDLKAGYNFEVKQDFTSHSALLKAAYKF